MQSDLSILYLAKYTTVSIDSVSGNEGPEQPALMIWACVVRKLHKGPFRAWRIISIFVTFATFSFLQETI